MDILTVYLSAMVTTWVYIIVAVLIKGVQYESVAEATLTLITILISGLLWPLYWGLYLYMYLYDRNE